MFPLAPPVIASFFGCVYGAQEFACVEVFCELLPGYWEFDSYFYFYIILRVYRATCPCLNKRGVVVATLWLVLVDMPSAHFAGTKASGRIHVWKLLKVIVSSALF